MKDFLHNYSYSAVKMFVNQFAISIFGAMLSMATTAAENNTLAVILSVLAIVFYLFLIYTQTWEIGAKDRISVDIGKKEYKPHTGLLISLLANIPNFAIAVAVVFAAEILPKNEFAGGIALVANLLVVFLEGMYLGILVLLKSTPDARFAFWWLYFLIIVPALLISWLAYYLGYKNKKFTTLFDYQSPDKSKKK